jgi:hypothetical protein
VDCEPLRPLEPFQAPDAAHDVALVLDQVRVEAVPDFTLLGAALNVTIGALLETVTVAVWVADPPAPVQVSSNSVVLVRAPECEFPLVGTLPRQVPAIMVQALAPADVQVRVELPPLLTVVGAAVNVTDGAGAAGGAAGATTETATDCVVLPPDPLQVSV